MAEWLDIRGDAEEKMQSAEKMLAQLGAPGQLDKLPEEKRQFVEQKLRELRRASARLRLGVQAAEDSINRIREHQEDRLGIPLDAGLIPTWYRLLGCGLGAGLDFLRISEIRDPDVPADRSRELAELAPGLGRADQEVCETIERTLIRPRRASVIFEMGLGTGWRQVYLSRAVRMVGSDPHNLQVLLAELVANESRYLGRCGKVTLTSFPSGMEELSRLEADVLDVLWLNRITIRSWANLPPGRLLMLVQECLNRFPIVMFRLSESRDLERRFRTVLETLDAEFEVMPLHFQRDAETSLVIMTRREMFGEELRYMRVSDGISAEHSRLDPRGRRLHRHRIDVANQAWRAWFLPTRIVIEQLPRVQPQPMHQLCRDYEWDRWRDLGGQLRWTPPLEGEPNERAVLNTGPGFQPLTPPLSHAGALTVIRELVGWMAALSDRALYWNDLRWENLAWNPENGQVIVLTLSRLAEMEFEDSLAAFGWLVRDLIDPDFPRHPRPIDSPWALDPAELPAPLADWFLLALESPDLPTFLQSAHKRGMLSTNETLH